MKLVILVSILIVAAIWTIALTQIALAKKHNDDKVIKQQRRLQKMNQLKKQTHQIIPQLLQTCLLMFSFLSQKVLLQQHVVMNHT